MIDEDVPDTLILISCPECEFQRTTEDPKATRVKIGGEKCPNCGHHYGNEAIVMRYKSVDKIQTRIDNLEEDLEEERANTAYHKGYQSLQANAALENKKEALEELRRRFNQDGVDD